MRPFLIGLFIFMLSFHSFSQSGPPVHSGELLNAADQLYDSGEYKKALTLCEKIDRNDTNYVKSLYGRAINLKADSQFSRAIAYCEEALTLRDQREMEPDIYNTYGNLFDAIGQTEKALSIFDEAINKYPCYSLLYYNKGIACFDAGRFAEAEAIFKQTLLINPYQYSAHFYLGLSALKQGKIIPAYLSFIGYLLINPDGKYSSRCVNILDAIARGKDEILDYKSKRKEEGDENYIAQEEILLSKIALEKEYKIQVSLDDPIFRQIQVVFEKLEYKEDDPDFWMQYYVPYYKKLFSEGKFEPFIFWAFENVQVKEIQAYNKKNKKLIDNFTVTTAEYFNLIRSTRALPYNKREGQINRYFFSEGKLQGKGELSNDGKDFRGPWTFYFPEGNIKATGQFNESGRYGAWTYYYFSGKIKARENFKNGKLDGKQLYYSENGLLNSDEKYLNDQMDGLQTVYYPNGQIHTLINYKSGKLDGEYKEFYSGGNLKSVKQFVNDVPSGNYFIYHVNGKLSESGNYQNGQLEGSYKEFHENGQLAAEGFFVKGKAEGDWTRYYDNGKLKTKTKAINNALEGVQEEFYEDGQLKETSFYKKGKLNGESVDLDKDQKPYARFQFADDILKSAVYLNKEGKQISSSGYRNGTLDLDIYLPEGTKSVHRVINEKGKIVGRETSYTPSGKISSTVEFENGEKTGPSIDYHLNGNKKTETPMKNGKQDGKVTAYYANGKIQTEGWFVEGQQQGMWYYYNESGNLSSQNYFINGELSGYLTEYYPNGKKSIEKKFTGGLLEELDQFDSTGKLLIHNSFPQYNGKYLLVYPNGNKMQECNYVKGAFDGRLTQYFFDGSVETIQYYKYGLLDSIYSSFYYHHKKNADGQFRAGKKTGLWKYFDEYGKLIFSATYANDVLHGPRILYSDDNKKELEINYKNGERDGFSSYIDPDGSLLYTVRYDEGNAIGYTYIGKDGKPVPEITADHGNLRLNAFFQNGKPSRQCTFKDGVINGTDILYYSSGLVLLRDSSSYGISEGEYAEYYPNGKPQRICHYHLDKPHGLWQEYNDRGILVREYQYYNGVKHGEAKIYSENGQLTETRYYFDDNILSIK